MTRRPRLPRVFCTIDDEPIGLANWSANSRANLGHDQLRGRITAERARGLLPRVTQGSVVKLWSETGFPLWQGRLALPPKPEVPGVASIAAQGHGYAAVKFAQRFPVRVRTGAAFTWASQAPLNMPSVFAAATTVPQVGGISKHPAGGTFDPPAVGFTGLGMNRCGAAIWAPGVRFVRLTGQLRSPEGGPAPVRAMTADGPNVALTARTEYQTDTSATVDLTFTHPGDCFIVEYARHLLDATTRDWIDERLLTDFTLYAETDADHVWTGDIAKVIGARVGYDTSRIGRVGLGPFSQWDWAGGAASGLDDLASRDDLCWRVLEDAGSGPVLEFGPYRKVWEVSGRTGARWNLDPLELYNRVVAQWVDTRGLVQVEYDADPDPLEMAGLENEVQVSLAGLTLDPDSASQTAWRILQAALAQRYRGTISTARAFEAGSGREATYEVRPGDLVRIRDFSLDGSITLRITDVEYGPDGISIGIEAPAIPMGALSAGLGGGNVFGSGGGGGAASGSAGSGSAGSGGGGAEAYLPPGAPGAPPPGSTGVNLGNVLPPSWGWGS